MSLGGSAVDAQGSGLRIDAIDSSWPRLGEVEELIYGILYRDFGVARDDGWRQPVDEGSAFVALDDDVLVGYAILLGGAGDAERQLRQMAVASEVRRRGVGRALVGRLEEDARASGTGLIWLNARETAIAFYERLGYSCVGDMFVSELTKIPHRPMKKHT
ncbi:MAG: GNAT family N-acetyltransferase [Coriobacteriia bacterium]|nr:GNAT family N-acetyltransferase [Coriobacteriia bacterium]